MVKKTPKAEWDKVAEWWDTEAGNSGVWHQKHDIDPVVLDPAKISKTVLHGSAKKLIKNSGNFVGNLTG